MAQSPARHRSQYDEDNARRRSANGENKAETEKHKSTRNQRQTTTLLAPPHALSGLTPHHPHQHKPRGPSPSVTSAHGVGVRWRPRPRQSRRKRRRRTGERYGRCRAAPRASLCRSCQPHRCPTGTAVPTRSPAPPTRLDSPVVQPTVQCWPNTDGSCAHDLLVCVFVPFSSVVFQSACLRASSRCFGTADFAFRVRCSSVACLFAFACRRLPGVQHVAQPGAVRADNDRRRREEPHRLGKIGRACARFSVCNWQG